MTHVLRSRGIHAEPPEPRRAVCVAAVCPCRVGGAASSTLPSESRRRDRHRDGRGPRRRSVASCTSARSAGAACRSAAQHPPGSSQGRGGFSQPALPILPARHERLRTEPVGGGHPGRQRRQCAEDGDGRELRSVHRGCRPAGGGAEAWTSHGSEQRAGVHRCLHRHLGPVRDQQRKRLVRGLDDPRPHCAGRRAAAPRWARAVWQAHRRGCRATGANG